MDTTRLTNADLGRQQLEGAYNQRDLQGILDCYIENPLFVDHTQKLTLTSIDEIREYVLAQWAPASKDEVTIEEMIDAGDWVIARFMNRGVNDGPFGALEPTNRPFEVEFWTVTKWQNGKIVEDHVYYDLYGLLAQLGHVEPLDLAGGEG